MYNVNRSSTVTSTGFCDNAPNAINGPCTDGGGNSLLYCGPPIPAADTCPADVDNDGTVASSTSLIYSQHGGRACRRSRKGLGGPPPQYDNAGRGLQRAPSPHTINTCPVRCLSWFGTNSQGAWRYDGDSLRNFTEEDGLTSKGVMAIYTDSRGDPWLGGNGVFKFNGELFDRIH